VRSEGTTRADLDILPTIKPNIPGFLQLRPNRTVHLNSKLPEIVKNIRRRPRLQPDSPRFVLEDGRRRFLHRFRKNQPVRDVDLRLTEPMTHYLCPWSSAARSYRRQYIIIRRMQAKRQGHKKDPYHTTSHPNQRIHYISSVNHQILAA